MKKLFTLLALIGVAVALWVSGRDRLREAGNHLGVGNKTVGPIARFVYRNDPWHSAAYPLALEKMALTPDDAYLDIACGAGGLLSQALETVDHAAGLDHSQAGIDVAREANAAALEAGRLELHEGDAGDLPWEDATFDAVSNLNTIHVMEDPLPLLREAHRVLKPGGRFLLVTQSPEALEGPMWGLMRSMLVLHSDDELASMLRDVGFSAVEAYSPDGDRQVGYGIKAVVDENEASG